MNKYLCGVAFLLGLAAVVWVGAGYIGSNPLALAMTVLIGAFYGMGVLELQTFHRASASLSRALAAVPQNLPTLSGWLKGLNPSLQNSVRLRVEGERVGLPGPAMTPYLVGLLVLLGMLGTFLGMVVTLNGAVGALESTTDLQAVRAALAAPVKGLGLAFGTSVAGVSASAMLGLMSALCRRERWQVAQQLDATIAADLRVFSQAHQRQETLKALQQQAEAMPKVVDQLQAMMAQLERQHDALNGRLTASQDSFHRNAESMYAELASSVGASLRDSLTEGSRLAAATSQELLKTLQSQAQALPEVADRLQSTMAQIEQHSEALNDRLVAGQADFYRQAESAYSELASAVDRSLKASVAESALVAGATMQPVVQAAAAGMARETAALHEKMAGAVKAQLEGVSQRFEVAVSEVSSTWKSALEQHRQVSDGMTEGARRALAVFADEARQNATLLVTTVGQAHSALQTELASREEQRLEAWRQALESTALALGREWQQIGAQALVRQTELCDTLERVARDIAVHSESQARATITEMAELMQAASEAPRAAAEVIGQMRQKLSESVAQDNQLLEERTRIVATVSSLLDAVNHASNEQRGAIDALVSSSASLLERIGARFDARVEAEADKMATAAAQITGGAVEVSSLGDAFGFAVQSFSESNDKLMGQLQRIEAALSQSLTRSDEQLAYYVAQAREIIDLSLLSQKQMVDDLQRLGLRQAPVAEQA